jgi:pimeloyl-ACP methyl ester carboxylesterase
MARTDEEPLTPDYAAKIFGRGFGMLCDPNDSSRFNPAIGPFTRWSLTDARRHDIAAMRGLDPALWQDPVAGRAALDDLHRHMQTDGDLLTSPSGAAFNLFQFYVLGQQLFDPHLIGVPVLIVRGDRDFANTGPATLELLSRFGSKEKAMIEIGNAGHGVFRQQTAPMLFSLSRAFFNDA